MVLSSGAAQCGFILAKRNAYLKAYLRVMNLVTVLSGIPFLGVEHCKISAFLEMDFI